MRTRGAAIAVVLGLLAGAGAGAVTTFAPTASGASRSLSVVQLGDSIASGEGTLYGYRYDPVTQRWTGGNVNVTWPGPYPGCHTSPDAYGVQVAKALKARFTTFACTGASFANGIVAPEVDQGLITTTLRPAEFGDWTTRQNLNRDYDAARPDIVLVTLGADDVHFSPVVRDCVANAVEHAAGLEALRCTSQNPGPMIASEFQTGLPTLARDLTTLAQEIRARGQADGHVPKVVFTTYHDPFPLGNQRCPDVALLDPTQVSYLSTVVPALNATIKGTVQGLHLPGVALADTSTAMVGPKGQNHRWCSAQPWAYGLSVIRLTDPSSLLSQAPFHPTPQGQGRYAALVLPVARKVLGEPG